MQHEEGAVWAAYAGAAPATHPTLKEIGSGTDRLERCRATHAHGRQGHPDDGACASERHLAGGTLANPAREITTGASASRAPGGSDPYAWLGSAGRRGRRGVAWTGAAHGARRLVTADAPMGRRAMPSAVAAAAQSSTL